MKTYWIGFFLFFVTSCVIRDKEIGKPENYKLTEREISEDCIAYQMRFNDGQYIFRFSLSGPCKNLTLENYIQEYSRYLSSQRDSLVYKRGYVILDFYNLTDTNNVLLDSVINITKRNFGAFVSLSEIDSSSITIKIFDKK